MEEPGKSLERLGGPVVRSVAARAVLDTFVAALIADEDFPEVRADVITAMRNRHAANTVAAYDYWLGRLERWLSDPNQRFRFLSAGPMPLEVLWPIDSKSETVLLSWVRDITKGPKDPDEYQEWAEATGPMSPSTLSLLVTAIKARTSERQDMPWEPSTFFQNTLRGFRRELRERYGSDRQAEPLLGRQHVAPIAEMLAPADSPDAARDRLLLELHAAGIDGGGIARLRIDSVREPRRGIRAATHAASLELYRDTGDVGLRSLVIAGQRRRGGNADRDTVLTLADHHQLERALDGYLAWRRTQEIGDGRLLLLAPSNPSQHIRAALGRLAELAPGVEWRPARDAYASAADVRRMREVLDRGLDWAGQLRRRRDHVMLMVGYLCALRRSELCGLRIRDIAFDGPKAIVTIPQSKTDQDARGVRLAFRDVPDGPAYLQGVQLLRAWIALLREDFGADRNDPLFPVLNRHNDLMHRRGAPRMQAMDPQSWSDHLRELAKEARVFGDDDDNSEKYDRVSGHSLRRGFVTSGILAGHDAVLIAKQTRHKNVTMILVYADQLHLLNDTDWAQVHFGDLTLLGNEAILG